MSTVNNEFDTKVAAIHVARVNVKSLAAEAKIIRAEARRCGSVYRHMLHYHRRGKLREESRYAQLALAFLRGKPYLKVEQKCAVQPVPQRLCEKIKRWFADVRLPEVTTWLQ